MVGENTFLLLQLIASLILVTGLLWMAGTKRGIFEAVLIFDTAKYWYGPSYSRREFTDGNKDDNHDAKVSYWERTFPDDGGHRTKLKEIVFLALAAAFTMNSFWLLLLASVRFENWFTAAFLWLFDHRILLLAVVAAYWFLVYSFAFDVSLSKHRKPPPPTHPFDEGDIYSPPSNVPNY